MIQSRIKSTRLPGKILLRLGDNHTVLGLCVERAKKSLKANSIVVLTTTDPADDRTVEESNSLGVTTYRGSESDVLSRYYHAAVNSAAEIIVRITSDCPFIDPILIDNAITKLIDNDLDYYCNQQPFMYPDGMDVDVFTFKMLETAHKEASLKHDREHVTPYMKKISQKTMASDAMQNYSKFRLTVDEPDDLSLSRAVYHAMEYPESTSWKQIVEFLENNPAVFDFNAHIRSNEGAEMSTGEKLYKRAKRVIPGGNMLLSKRPEMFLQSGWPSYFSKAKGCEIWDLDDNKYLDMSIMGIGTNTLGYAYSAVDEEVKKSIDNSNMSTFNCPEEVYLAEKLISLHPWAENAKFARTGGEINAIAIRVARAASGRSEVVICGYHGWHDWYLSANLSTNSALNDHLLPGLDTVGVPKELAGLTHAIKYNSFEDLKILDQNKSIGILIMEVMRSELPAPGYLEAIRDKCTKNNIILIFDECTSGFRETFGGLHLKFGVNPDLATYGKALGNGFAITALLGKENVMHYSNKSFVSSTFWSEKLGYVAALSTLNAMEATNSWEVITSIGKKMQQIWQRTFELFQIETKISGIPALSTHSILGENGNVIKTLITQELLKKNIIGTNIFYPSIAHTDWHLDFYEEALNDVLNKIIKSNDLFGLLDSNPAQTGFGRLN
jgi:glutamate-1-semialdehyde 2,1-aminomutase